MKEIQLTQGKVALVDDKDFKELNQYKWFAHKSPHTYYAQRWSVSNNGKRKCIHMHREILGVSHRLLSDHRDGNGLNNQRYNLRSVTARQNCQNMINKNKTSEYPGVDWHKSRRKWRARIYVNGIQRHLGRFASEKEAFNAYLKAVNAIGDAVIG